MPCHAVARRGNTDAIATSPERCPSQALLARCATLQLLLRGGGAACSAGARACTVQPAARRQASGVPSEKKLSPTTRSPPRADPLTERTCASVCARSSSPSEACAHAMSAPGAQGQGCP